MLAYSARPGATVGFAAWRWRYDQTPFGHLLPLLARDREIIAFEQQGFGHTTDVADRSFDFERSAHDTAALLEYLQIDQADIFGFSNGGTIAFILAIRHPARVRKLVVASAFFKRDGGYPWFGDSFTNVHPGNMSKELQDACREVSPHPENLQSFFDKCVERMRNFKDIPDAAIRSIKSPALVIVRDADVMRPGHAVETFRLIANSRVAILPGTAHMKVTARAGWLVPMINEFLGSSPVK
jgi:pimeloyl-ACP methyl ester carboxylesterase